MNKRHYLILEALLKSPEGLSREELNTIIQAEGFRPLDRKRFFQDMKHIRDITHLDTTSKHCGKNVWKHGIRMESETDRSKAEFVHMLIANLWESEFLNDFRQLGHRIQPISIPHGNQYLHRIGQAMLESRTILLTYQKFTDTKPYTCTIEPYCLKIFQGRWYLLANKREEGMLKHFALDRIARLSVQEESFTMDPTFDSTAYYSPFFGIWCDTTLPIQHILLTTTPEQAHYFRTLPLHHSQEELPATTLTDGTTQCHFMLHMCITPDFELEMKKYEGSTRWEVREP